MRGGGTARRVSVLCVALCAASLVSADVKVVAKVTVAGATAAKSGTKQVTTYYKGSMIRTEIDGRINIYDTKSQTITTLNPADRTYQVLDLKQAVTSMPTMLAKIKLEATASVEPLPDRTTIAGKPAKKYKGSATIRMGAEGMASGAYPTTKIELEQWVTESVSEGTLQATLAPLKQFTGPLEPYGGMESVIKEFSKMKGLPLSSRVTVTMSTSGNGRAPQGPITTTTEVQVVDESPLSDSLFQIPDGYQRAAIRTPQKPNRKAP